MAGLAVWPAEGTRVEVEWENEFIELPGIASWEETQNDAPRRVIRAFSGTASRTGTPEPPTVACEVVAYSPRHPAWRRVREAALANAAINVRLFTPPTELLFKSKAADSGATAAIATTGVVTLATADEEDPPDLTTDTYAPGMAIWIAGKWYTIMSIDDDSDQVKAVDDTTNKYPSSAVTAAQFAVGLPRQGRSSFAAEISATDGASIRTENQLSSGFNINPTNRPPEFVYQIYANYAALPST